MHPPAPTDPSFNGVQDAFLLKLNSTGSDLPYGTFLGGDDLDSGDGIAISNTNGIYLTGEAGPANFPTTTGPAFGGGDNDSFAAKFQIDVISTPPPTFTISGTIRTAAPESAPVAGIAVTAGNRTTTTGSDGKYRLTDLLPGDYTVIPSKSNATFQPPSYTVNLSSDMSGKDFILQTPLFHISGRVTNSDGSAGLAGVNISAGTGGSATTDADGKYAMQLAAGAYTFTPSRDKYTFDLPSLNVAVADDHEIPLIRGVFIPPPGPRYIPIVRHDTTVIEPPKCDAYEPNDDRFTNAHELVFGQAYQAKLCANDEDNYIFILASAKKPIISLTLPDTLREKTLIYVYNKANLSANANICGEGGLPNSAVITLTNCPLLPAGTSIVVRIYPNTAKDFDNQSPYTLLVTP